jgi:hypothetical protein
MHSYDLYNPDIMIVHQIESEMKSMSNKLKDEWCDTRYRIFQPSEPLEEMLMAFNPDLSELSRLQDLGRNDAKGIKDIIIKRYLRDQKEYLEHV